MATQRNGRNQTAESQRKTAAENKFWNFKLDERNNTGELVIYGEIAAAESWFGDVYTQRRFNAELDALGDVGEITVRINSPGGDVFAAVAIFTRLKSHPASITVVIDGWAASSATIIAMAGDSVKISAAASFMIHDPSLGLFGYYTKDDLRTMTNELEVCKECILQAYVTKSSKTKDEISALMSATTWYTGQQAVDEGFCDEVLFGESGSKPIVTDLANSFAGAPAALLSGGDTREKPQKAEKQDQNQLREGSNEMDIKNLDDLRAAYPELCEQLETGAANAERLRVKNIEELAPDGFEKIASEAKFEKPESAADFAMRLVAEIKKQGSGYLKDRQSDADESGVNNAKAEPPGSGGAGFGGKDAADEAIDRMPDRSKGGAA
jgi:ATP-dependent protease ClpP protease subunit